MGFWFFFPVLSGVVRSNFNSSDLFSEVFCESQLDLDCIPASCDLTSQFLETFKHSQCTVVIDSSRQPSVWGRVRKFIDFWRLLEISQFILNVISQGYKILFSSFRNLFENLTMLPHALTVIRSQVWLPSYWNFPWAPQVPCIRLGFWHSKFQILSILHSSFWPLFCTVYFHQNA